MDLEIGMRLKDANKTTYLVKDMRKNKRMKNRIEWLCVRESDSKEMYCPIDIINQMESEGLLTLIKKKGRPKK